MALRMVCLCKEGMEGSDHGPIEHLGQSYRRYNKWSVSIAAKFSNLRKFKDINYIM